MQVSLDHVQPFSKTISESIVPNTLSLRRPKDTNFKIVMKEMNR